jgi:transposase InsO family protein
MIRENPGASMHRRWAEFRLSVIGPLLACPPSHGELKRKLKALAKTSFTNPITKAPQKFSWNTLERWYYLARDVDHPVNELIKKTRGDRGVCKMQRSQLAGNLTEQYREHPSWSMKLHYDNLQALATRDLDLGLVPSYTTIRRFMRSNGLVKVGKNRGNAKSSEALSRMVFDARETRSFEAYWPGSLWHLDFHKAKRRVLNAKGQWLIPILLAILDDRSRLVCHMQWYEEENTDCLVHGFRQALQKRGRPVQLLNDNGSAMTSAEFTEGLNRLSIIASNTLPYCPEQNGKQERFFGTVEGRLMKMLENKENLTLKELNDASAAWIEADYNRQNHRELDKTPLEIFLSEKNMHKNCPSSEELTLAFTRQNARKPRRFDSTLTIKGVRYEIPWAYRHLPKVFVRYAEWDLSVAWLMDQDGEKPLAKIYPQNKQANFSGERRTTNNAELKIHEPKDEIAPLLKQIMAEYAATGLPPAYLSKSSLKETNIE